MLLKEKLAPLFLLKTKKIQQQHYPGKNELQDSFKTASDLQETCKKRDMFRARLARILQVTCKLDLYCLQESYKKRDIFRSKILLEDLQVLHMISPWVINNTDYSTLYHAIYRCVVIYQRQYIDTSTHCIVATLLSIYTCFIQQWTLYSTQNWFTGRFGSVNS